MIVKDTTHLFHLQFRKVNMSNSSFSNLKIVNLNVERIGALRRKKGIKYIRRVAEKTNADIIVLHRGCPDDEIDGYKKHHGCKDDGSKLLYNIYTITVSPITKPQCSIVYTLNNFAVFTGLSVLSVASYGRVSRSFSLASWEPVIFAEGSALALTNLVRALHDCIGATETPVLSIGRIPIPINIDEVKYYAQKGNVDWDARYLEEIQENICNDTYITTERVMTSVRDLNKLKVRSCDNGSNETDVVIASRCLNTAELCPLDLNHTTGTTGRSGSIQGFRPTTSLKLPLHPPTMLGA
ncbi:hypothetical protein DPMN_148210 [Dreissena polymorpha]|uniref:Uncharacterized protein n=3 Tax=Dreissena polymorpha TaxID=45954 RepID=A0A9D4FF41_DREPO|nr:hypothetical protein DPMN_148210 [Dreissena polymorpha]